jgi:hypothetical protein
VRPAELPSLLRLLDPQGVRQPLWPVLLESLTGRWPADDSVDLVGELSCGPGVPKRPNRPNRPPLASRPAGDVIRPGDGMGNTGKYGQSARCSASS